MSSSNQALDNFINFLVEEKFKEEIIEIEFEAKEGIRKELLPKLNDFIMDKFVNALSKEDIAKFEHMLKQGASEAEQQQFFFEHIDDYTNFLTNVLLEFQDIYLGKAIGS
jgi:hypothetical protein